MSAPKMLQVPSVTMNGGSRSRVTRTPLTKPQSEAGEEAEREGDVDRHAVDRPPSWPMTIERQDHDGADREVDAGGEDDQRLRDAEDAR